MTGQTRCETHMSRANEPLQLVPDPRGNGQREARRVSKVGLGRMIADTLASLGW